MEERILFHQMVLGQLYGHMQKNEVGSLPHIIYMLTYSDGNIALLLSKEALIYFGNEAAIGLLKKVSGFGPLKYWEERAHTFPAVLPLT